MEPYTYDVIKYLKTIKHTFNTLNVIVGNSKKLYLKKKQPMYFKKKKTKRTIN